MQLMRCVAAQSLAEFLLLYLAACHPVLTLSMLAPLSMF